MRWNFFAILKAGTHWTSGSCVYLTVEDQQCLDFGIVDLIPFKAYTRKNIGYLWAVQQGATTIFDTDDDNLPNTPSITFDSRLESAIAYRSDNGTSDKSVNIYSHFGRPDVWPRGFALSEIDVRRPVSYLPSYGSLPDAERKLVAPPTLIQQGLADLDPDVDAIYRLTQVQELKNIKFCKKSPTLRLSPGTFCPFNSQRLLWDVNGSLAFTKPTVDQIRNAHDYLADYKDELQLYAESSRFIDFLSDWSSPSTDLGVRIVDLMRAMTAEKFIEAADVDLAERWVKDLRHVGYVFPKVTRYDRKEVEAALSVTRRSLSHPFDTRVLSSNALKQCQADVETDPDMAKIQIVDSYMDTAAIFKDILLVVNFNWPLYDAIEPFLEIHEQHFPNIVFYGEEVPENLTGRVKSVISNRGHLGYKSLLAAMEEYPNYKGYLYTNDDTLLNIYQLTTFDQDKVWKKVPIFPEEINDRSKEPPVPWFHWNEKNSSNMWNDSTSLTAEQRQRVRDFTKVEGPVEIQAFIDAVYIPRRISVELNAILTRFHKYGVFSETAVGLALVAIEPTENWVNWNETYLWDDARTHWRDYLKPQLGMLHPVKLLADPENKHIITRWIDSVEV
ncbi:hypothetical protein BGZ72_008773 [Mortierella alpina]|nr:hypothetical protein BGZ72_008773 [Mortierella alpina]